MLILYYSSSATITNQGRKIRVQSKSWGFRSLGVRQHYDRNGLFWIASKVGEKKLPCGRVSVEFRSAQEMSEYLAKYFPRLSWNPNEK